MLSLYSQPDQNGTSPAEKLFGHKLRATLSSLIPSTQSTTIEKHIFTQNLRRKLSQIDPGTTVQIRTDKQNLWEKTGIVVSQNNRSRSYNILNKKRNILAKNRRHLIPKTIRI